jgi:hypothetical protein
VVVRALNNLVFVLFIGSWGISIINHIYVFFYLYFLVFACFNLFNFKVHQYLAVSKG